MRRHFHERYLRRVLLLAEAQGIEVVAGAGRFIVEARGEALCAFDTRPAAISWVGYVLAGGKHGEMAGQA